MSYEFLEDVAIADIAFRAWGKIWGAVSGGWRCHNQYND